MTLAVAVAAVSTAAPAIRLGESPALAVAFWRVCLAALAIGVISLFTTSQRRGRTPAFVMWAGVCLGLHFWTWIASLDSVSVARSVLLVTTKPVWAALLGRIFLKEQVSRAAWLGILLVVAGTAVATGGGDTGLGDLLAILGAVLGAAYIVLGRHERTHWDILPFLVRVYGWAAVTLLVALLVTSTPALPQHSADWLVYAFLAAIPTGVGHSLYNYSLARLPAHVVATALTLEPYGASIFAYLLFGELPEPSTWWAAPVVGLGLWLVVRPPRKRVQEAEEA